MIHNGDVVHSHIGWRKRLGAINKTKEIITSKKGLELNFPGHIVVGVKLKRGLSRDADGNEVEFIGTQCS